MNPLGSVLDIVPVISPLDWQTARNGDYVSLKNAKGVLFVIHKGQGTDGDDPTFTLRQATTVAGGSVKDAAVITEYWEKEENAANLEATGAWTRVTQTAAATIAPGDPSAQSAALYAFYVEADSLDVDGGFDCVTVNIGDTGTNAQLGNVLAILVGLRYPAAPQNLPNSIAN